MSEEWILFIKQIREIIRKYHEEKEKGLVDGTEAAVSIAESPKPKRARKPKETQSI